MKLRKKKILYGKQQSTTKKGEVYMGKAKKCIIAICIAVLLVGVGAGTIIYRQAQGNESLWGTCRKLAAFTISMKYLHIFRAVLQTKT